MSTKSKTYLALLIVIILSLFFGLDDSILYAKSGVKKWIPYILLFLIIPLITKMFLVDFTLKKSVKTVLTLVPIIILGPLFGLWWGHLANKQLNEDAKITNGIVTEKILGYRRGGSSNKWLIKCSFQAEGKTFITFSKKDVNNLYEIGDTLTIKYSEQNPKNHIIVELKN